MLTKNKTKPIAIISFDYKEHVDIDEINEALLHIRKFNKYSKCVEVDTQSDEYVFLIYDDNISEDEVQKIYDSWRDDFLENKEDDNWE